VQIGEQFVPWDQFGDAVAAPNPAAEASHGPDDSLTIAGQGNAGTPWQIAVPALAGWAYAAFDLPALTDADAGLVFEARDAGGTPQLALELVEQDGSRWKQVVDLGKDWQTYRLHTSGFASYASPARNGAQDGFRPSQGRRLTIGFTKGMLGGGTHRFELRHLRVHRADVPAGRLTAAEVPHAVNAAARWYFPTAADGFRRTVWPTCFAATAAADDGWLVNGPSAQDDRTGLFPHQGQQDWRLLRPSNDPAIGLVSHHAGPYSGSAWAAVGHQTLSEADLVALHALLAELAAGPALSPLQVRPAVPSETRMVAQVTIVNRATAPLRDQLRLLDGAGQTLAQVPLDLAPRQAAGLTLPLPDLAWGEPLRLSLALRDHRLLDPPTAGLDLRTSLREMADFFVASGADDGKFSGVSFVDNRGARTLLGAWRIFEERTYLDAAVAWGNAMVPSSVRRRVPHGLGSLAGRGLLCRRRRRDRGRHRLPRARPRGEQRETFKISTLHGLPQDFPVPTGGIGVGGASRLRPRPVVPLDTPTRIYAPEQNPHHLLHLRRGLRPCRLGATPQLSQLCEPTRWFMPAQELYGAGARVFCSPMR